MSVECAFAVVRDRQVACLHPVASRADVHGRHPHIGVCAGCTYRVPCQRKDGFAVVTSEAIRAIAKLVKKYPAFMAVIISQASRVEANEPTFKIEEGKLALLLRQNSALTEVAPRPRPGIKEAVQAAVTIATAVRVPEELFNQRLKICAGCDRVKQDSNTLELYCGVCGCPVSADIGKVVNIARYAETGGTRLCKHPDRGEGKGWPL